MFRKSLMLAALVGVMTPMVAHSWTLTTRVNSVGGTLSVGSEGNYTQNKVGVVMKNYTTDRKSTRLNSSHSDRSRMPSSA